MSRQRQVRRRNAAAEVVARVALVALAIYALPHVFTGDIDHFYRMARTYSFTDLSRTPYRYVAPGQRSYEFPPLTLPFLALQRLAPALHAYRWIFGLAMAAFEYATLVLLRRTWPDHRRDLNAIWYASVVPLGTLAWFRFDFAAVFLAAIALVALERGRRGGAGSVVAGFAVKLWPAVLIPCLAVRRRWSAALAAAAGCAAVVGLWHAFSPSGFRRFLDYRKGTGLEVESVPASIRLFGHHGRVQLRSGAWVIDAGHFGSVDLLLTAALGAYSALVVVRAWRGPRSDVAALGGALTLASFLFSRIISAQYLVWTAPFVAVLWARGNRRLGWLNAASTACTLIYLLFFTELLRGNRVLSAVLLARNAILVAMLVELTFAITGGSRAADSGSSSAPASVRR